jgi:hypothetical protein
MDAFSLARVPFPRLLRKLRRSRILGSSNAHETMPRFSVRNIVVTINIILLTALVVHLKQVLWDRQFSSTDLGTSHIPDELLDDSAHEKASRLQVNTGPKSRRTAVVVAAQTSENTTWLDMYFPNWEKNIYRVDDPSAPLTVPKNKGRESMVYLTSVLSAS